MLLGRQGNLKRPIGFLLRMKWYVYWIDKGNVLKMPVSYRTRNTIRGKIDVSVE